MKNIEKVDQYLSEVGTFYFATVDDDKPKCRPISFHMLLNDKIYFGVGTFKEVYQQLSTNSNIEVCACKNNGFLRYYGKAVFETDPAYTEKAMEVLPMLRQIYNSETGYTLGIFHLENATAEFRSMLNIEESYSF